MIVKFHKKTERIKGLSFHSKQPWLLVGFYSGEIQIIDYRYGRTINEFSEHEGPVISVQFHQSLSLFISDSDDSTVRVWNYTTKKCQFVLRGHLDFVRCVNFHSELPWCVSGSDDQTSRIWNYQTRQRIATVTGHSHYVMHCEFHPSKDFMITCSLVQEIRLWSITQLKKKFIQKSGVNWCSFNPKDGTILSASDDKKIKLWKYFETRGYELETYQGHFKIRLLDFGIQRKVLKLIVLLIMNQWICAVHQSNYYFAAGSYSALYIFTLFKNRPAFNLVNDNILYLGTRKLIKILDLQKGSNKTIKNLQELSCLSDNLLQDNVEQILYNIYENQKLQFIAKLKSHSHSHSKSIGVSKYLVYEQNTNTFKFFLAKSAIFIGKSNILKSRENSELEIYNFQTDNYISLDYKADRLFTYNGGKAIFYTDSMINVLDPIQNKIINQISCKKELQMIIVFQYKLKKEFILFTRDLLPITQILEKINIKSVLFLSDSINIVLYSTKVHVKYLLLNGDNGIISSMKTVPYLIQLQPVKEKSGFYYKLFYMNNMEKLLNIKIEFSEIFQNMDQLKKTFHMFKILQIIIRNQVIQLLPIYIKKDTLHLLLNQQMIKI
ncbi:unnamed protein product [Paramecium sonneborni]|uniref:Coatomer alpha subunit n=1 Tax=Paramecium sonneborni TaxID=65129 RepID=A0A8S1LGT1_9CILI|nr:unnamed protein product [Paramecium sonneborni]